MTLVKTAIDAHAYESAPATNYAKAVKLALNGGAGTNDRLAFLHFALPPILGGTVVAATLRLHAAGAWSGTQTLTVKRVVEKWAEGTLTWAKQPAVVATNSAALVVTGAADGAEFELDVTALMGDIANGAAYFGLRLELGSDVLRYLHSAEAKNERLRPELEIEWAVKPDPPSSLAPAGGRAISVTKPVLSWEYVDKDAGAQTSSQVQVSTSEDFTAPAYDSGKVANELTSWDLAATAFAALADGAVRHWRVRVWDDYDLASDWADPVEFAREAKGTLTLVSPTGPTVEDLTPPVDWTLDVTQEAYRIDLIALHPVSGDPGAVVWSTGRVTDATTGPVTIAQPLIAAAGAAYRLRLRVWDDVDREAVAGDPDYVEATVDIAYDRSGAPAPVTSLTVAKTPSAAGPGVVLEWQRATQPDYFALRVDGVNVPGYERIDPGDTFVSGTTYRMTFWGGTPRVAHEYEIEAVVDSAGVLEHSDGNATATLTLTTTGVWLVDPDDGLAVRIVATDATPDIGIGESGATHYLRGRRDPVRIVDTVRGYEGSVGGILQGKTARDAFLELYSRLKPLRLVIGDLTLLVEISAPAPTPTSAPNDRRFACSFAFVQVGAYTFDVVGG